MCSSGSSGSPFPFSFSSSLFFLPILLLLPLSFASHGIRQRNSSVPLREVVDTSKSRATALIAGPAGRQAVLGVGFGDCPHCDAKKCGTQSSSDSSGSGLCLTIRDGDGLPLAQRCVGTRKELNRALRDRGMEAARGRAGGCERGQQGTELCWCEATAQKSLLEEGLASPEGRTAASIQHARRRKNHHGRQVPQQQSPATTATLKTEQYTARQLSQNNNQPTATAATTATVAANGNARQVPVVAVVVWSLLAAVAMSIIP